MSIFPKSRIELKSISNECETSINFDGSHTDLDELIMYFGYFLKAIGYDYEGELQIMTIDYEVAKTEDIDEQDNANISYPTDPFQNIVSEESGEDHAIK